MPFSAFLKAIEAASVLGGAVGRLQAEDAQEVLYEACGSLLAGVLENEANRFP